MWLQVAYVFRPDEGEARPGRPVKKRKVSMAKCKNQEDVAPGFVPLLNGAEPRVAVQKREKHFTEGWNEVHGRIQVRTKPVKLWRRYREADNGVRKS